MVICGAKSSKACWRMRSRRSGHDSSGRLVHYGRLGYHHGSNKLNHNENVDLARWRCLFRRTVCKLSGMVPLRVHILFLVRLFNMKRNEDATPDTTQRRMYWTLPAFMYVTIIAEYLAGMLGRESVQVTSQDQHVWWTGDIYGSLTLVSLFTVLPIFIFCLYRLSKDFSKE